MANVINLQGAPIGSTHFNGLRWSAVRGIHQRFIGVRIGFGNHSGDLHHRSHLLGRHIGR